MKSFISILLVFSMMSNITVSLVRQMKCCELTELSEMDTDDADGKEKSEKELEKEKETCSFFNCPLFRKGVSFLENMHQARFPDNDNLISEAFIQLPELPPEA